MTPNGPLRGLTRVLIIESDPRLALLVGQMLRTGWDSGLVISQVERVRDAGLELRDHGAACVLLDIPGEDEQIEALEQLRMARPDAPVIVLSESDDEAHALRALRAGAEDVLAKGDLCSALLRRSVTHAVERKHSEAQLAHQALHDTLTGLPNRALFLDRLTVAMDRLRRSPGHIAVLFVDLDNFKQINDTLGHAAGDRVLVVVADRLRKMLRPTDTVARYGGDEFTFLFEDLTSEREVSLVADRISRIMALPIALEDGQSSVAVSIGIANIEDADVSPEEVMREADAAMYRVKESRRRAAKQATATTRDSPDDAPDSPDSLEGALRSAIERSELLVHYQPKVSLHDRSGVLGLEALVRWEHPQRGLVGPPEFIPLAETSGLIIPLGLYVIERALTNLGPWRQLRPGVTVSVNLSASQLVDEELTASVARAIDAAGVAPDALSLEVSELDLDLDHARASRAIADLKAIGVRVAIDDYGTGSTSISHLRGLNLDALKIHESFVGELGGGNGHTAAVAAVVELAHALGLRAVAEGVETEAQMTELQSLGCDEAQGFFFSRPVPAEQVQEMLAIR